MASTRTSGLARASIDKGRKTAPHRRPRSVSAGLHEFARVHPFGPLQAKLTIGQANDRYEAEADRVADAVAGARDAAAGVAAGAPSISRLGGRGRHRAEARSAAGGAGLRGDVAQRQPVEEEEEEELQAKAYGGAVTASADAEAVVGRALRGPGESLPGAVREPLESRIGADFGAVRIHRGARAGEATRTLGARAFTVGRDIVFGAGQFQPGSHAGRRLLAHELTHVVQQGAAPARAAGRVAGRAPDAPRSRLQPACACGGVFPKCRQQATSRDETGRGRSLATDEREQQRVRRGAAVPDLQMDLAVAPPAPDAVAAPLSETDIASAIAYNASRFIDPFSISIVRDVVGIPRWPAVSDRALALAVAQWQANFRLRQDGKVGPRTTRTLVRELRGENQRRLARQLREDNSVDWRSVRGPRRGRCGMFTWNVQWGTPLRGGWIIQRIDNTFTAMACGGGTRTPRFTARYWEAWWVTPAGVVRRPTSVATPPTTAVIGSGGDDLWGNGSIPGSRGNWSISARLYTTLTLPVGFAIGSVPDAAALPATTGPVRSDDLGLVAASRRRGGRWDCCHPNPANHFHRPA